jgi:hypothetical protein
MKRLFPPGPLRRIFFMKNCQQFRITAGKSGLMSHCTFTLSGISWGGTARFSTGLSFNKNREE